MGHWTIKLGKQNAPLAKVHLYEYKNPTLEAFVAASRSYAKFDCLVARQKKLAYKIALEPLSSIIVKTPTGEGEGGRGRGGKEGGGDCSPS